MTAPGQDRQREALGLWRDSEGAQRREVVVALGDASLVIANRTETALAHWSLAAIERVNPGRHPAAYAPGPDAEERLEIEDPDMIEAIERVRARIARSGPHPGRLRWLLASGAGLALLAVAVLWLPGALTRQTASLLPPASRAEIGAALLDEIAHLAGAPCAAPRGRAALAELAQRLFEGGPAPVVAILPAAVPDTLALPGNILVANAALAEDHETPEVLAGYLLAEDVRRHGTDPALALLREAGLGVTFRLLTTGDIPAEALRDHAVRLLSRAVAPVEDGALLVRFAEAGVASTPYAYARDVSGETVLALIEADPARAAGATAPLLSDEAWIGLQEICLRG